MKPHIMRGVRGGIAIAVLGALGWLAGCSDNPAGVASVRSFAAVSAGGIHTCGVTAARDAYCWGHNLYGELGVDPTTTSETCPGAGGPLPCSTVQVRVAGDRTFAAVSVGFLYSCGVTPRSAAYCWGNDVEGQLGDGSTSISGTPVAVAGNLRFSSVSTGDYHTCGLTTNGTVYCWGRNDNGELGNGSTTWSSTPVAVAGGLTFSAVSVGYDYSCAVTADGAAYCWGSNLAGRLGNGSTVSSSSPVAVAGGLSFTALATGGAHTCGLTSAGAAYCWGLNLEGQLGVGSTTSNSSPVAVAGGLSFTALATGGAHTCGLTSAGAAFCWGNNLLGQLGVGTATGPESCPYDQTEIPCSTVPVPVSGGVSFATMSAGYAYTCGVTAARAAYCWGGNYWGQLGDGTRTDRYTPTRVVP